MTTDTSPSSLAAMAEQAAQRAISPQAQERNTTQVAALADSAGDAQRAEHIRGIVATTMAQISVGASAVTQAAAQQWQAWALGVAQGLDNNSLAPAVRL